MITEHLAAYDRQLRGRSETVHALAVTEFGPLLLAEFDGGRGFISGRDLDANDVGMLVDAVIQHFTSRPGIRAVEDPRARRAAARGGGAALRDHR